MVAPLLAQASGYRTAENVVVGAAPKSKKMAEIILGPNNSK
jgi:hypothetical protein